MLEHDIYSKDRFPRAIFRSLLQKSVRRGYSELAASVAQLLANHGDSKWLHTRIGVIIFEECWPLAKALHHEKNIFRTLESASKIVKNKNAAGLGALAYAYSTGDKTAVQCVAENQAIKIVAEGIKRPDAFFRWVSKDTMSTEQMAIVNSAEIYFRQATWPWDKAFMIAASYLAKSTLPSTCLSNISHPDNFPFWVAIDKHTPEGKIVLKSTANKLNISYQLLSHISFYLESSHTNEIIESPWWETEKKWRLIQLCINETEAELIWSRAKTLIKEDSLNKVEQIKKLLNHSTNTLTPDLFQ